MTLPRVPLLVLAIALVLLVPGSADATVSFTPTSYPLPTADTLYHDQTGAVSAVDLNNDGLRDIVVYRGGGNVGQVYVMVNLGGGTFASPQTYAGCGSSETGGHMVTGQFNAGQAADVILGCDSATGLDLLLGNGDGTLGPKTNFPSIGFNNAMALWPGDNGDFPAVIYSQTASNFILCFRVVNDLGNPQCLPDTSDSDADGPSGHAPVSGQLATGHFYDNTTCGRDDLIFSAYGRAIHVWGLNPFGTVAVPACHSYAFVERAVNGIPGAETLQLITPGDLTGDGTPDLLMTTNGSSIVVLPWLGGTDANGFFPPGQQSNVTPTITGIGDQKLADFDGDGRLDVALVGEAPAATTGTLAVHTGRGDGTFNSPPATFSVPGGSPDTFNSIGPNRLALGDLNNDGKPDLVSIAQYGDAVTVLLNGSSPPATTPPPQPVGPGPPPPPPPGAAPDTTRPTITSPRLTTSRFAVAPASTPLSAAVKRGTTIRYSLSEQARVVITIFRKQAGRRRGRACVKPTPKLRRATPCLRSARKGALSRSGAAGANSVKFSGRLGTKALPVGSYSLTLLASDPAGNKSRPASVNFEIVSAKP